MTIEECKKFPFVFHADEGCILQAVPSGFVIITKTKVFFIDGGTHEISVQENHPGYDGFMAMPAYDPDWFEKRYGRKPTLTMEHSFTCTCGYACDSAAEMADHSETCES